MKRCLLPGALALLSGLLPGACAQAADAAEFEDAIPIDLARAIAPGTTFLDSLPADLSGFTPPPGLRVLGTRESAGSQLIVLDNDGSPAEGAEALQRAILALPDWLEVSDALQLGAVFVPAEPDPEAGDASWTLCHDGHGLLSLLALPDALLVYRQPSGLPVGVGQSFCRLYAGRGQPEFGLGLNLPAALPRLTVPTGIGLRMRGMSTSPGRIRQEATLARMPHSLAALRNLFGEQLQAQSWRETARWTGTRGAGISVEKVLDGGRVGGVLELLHLDDGGTEAAFTISQRARNGSGGPLLPLPLSEQR